jgi:chemotaxis protein MotB
MSRRTRSKGHANHERWLVSYADFITLLFAFFVVMFSSSQVDKRKVGALSQAIQAAFQQLGIFENSNTRIPLADNEPLPFSDVQLVENTVRSNSFGHVFSRFTGGTSTRSAELARIRTELEQALSHEISKKSVAIKTRRDGLVISLREIGFFDSGSASLRPEAAPAVDRIAAVISERPNFIRIEGHTDNVPIHSTFASNWELSTTRATNFIQMFISKYHFSPAQLSAAGYAEFHPVANNATPEGRALNRRLGIVILPPENIDPDLYRTTATESQSPSDAVASRSQQGR